MAMIGKHMTQDDRRRGFYMSIGAQFATGFTLLTLIWAGGAAYQRLIYLENQVSVLNEQAAKVTDLKNIQNDLESSIKELELILESDLKLERAFSRSICVALSHTQTAAGVPVTNDCDRP